MSLWINFNSMPAIFWFPVLGRLQLEANNLGVSAMVDFREDKAILRLFENTEIRFNALIQSGYTWSNFAGV